MCNFDITTVAIGFCASIATILFLLGNKRYITPNSTIVVHSAGYEVERMRLTEAETLEKFNEAKEYNNKIIKCYLNSSNFKMIQGELKVIFSSGRDYKYSPLEAINEGFATDIITDISQIM